LLLTVMTPDTALAVDAGSFVVSAGVLRFCTRSRPARSVPEGSLTRNSLDGVRAVLAHPGIRRILLLSWLIPACAVAPEALATPYVVHIGEAAHTAGYLLTGLPVGAVVGELIVGRALRADQQRRLVVPSILVVMLPLLSFVVEPGLALATALLALSGLGFAYSVGQDAQLIETAPPDLRTRALAVNNAGLMFIQGLGFALWGLAGQIAPIRVVIPLAGVIGLVVVALLRPTS
jgi:predicted MFS family arabinose efflux permease